MNISDRVVREQALDINKSFIIRAPAGSGKTELLVQRALTALLSVSQPSQCLILTFTQKAVCELQNRVTRIFSYDSKLLETTQSLKSQVLVHAKKNEWPMSTFWHQIKIKTLDSYFMELVKKYSPKVKFESHKLSLTPELQSQLILNSFFEEFLIKNPDPTLLKLCTIFENSFSQLQSLLEEIYQMREVWLTNVLQNEQVLPQSTLFFQEQVYPFTHTLHSSLKEIEEIYLWVSSYKKYDLIDFTKSEVFFDLNLWKFISELCLTRSGTIRKKLNKSQGIVPDKELFAWHSKEEKKNIFERLIIINYLALFLATFGLITLLVGLLLT